MLNNCKDMKVKILIDNKSEVERMLKALVNDHPHSGWLEFSAIGRRGKNTLVI